MMENKRLQIITRSAVLLALTIVLQYAGRLLVPYLGSNNNFIVGPLVNACLLVSAAYAGIWGASVIAAVAPFGAIATGASIPILFAPFISLGNLIIVLVFFALMRKNKYIAVAAASVLKFAFLYAAIIEFVKLAAVKTKMANALIFTFSWPQLVTALAGGIIAILIIGRLEKVKGLKMYGNPIKTV